MNRKSKRILFAFSLLVATWLFFGSTPVFAHCDTMNGPVVKAAQKALERGNVNLVLIWVQKKDEAEITEAFKKTLAMRKLNAEAKQLADMYFFETLVRIHRAGEGAPYTGLKPAGFEPEPGIAAADKAIETDSGEALVKDLTETIRHGVHERFTEVMAKKNFKPDDVEAGREYVNAYVTFIHYIEGLYQATTKPVEGHSHESESVGVHEEQY
ncbi:MAG: DUF6448 family protein [Bacteroidota bacterium]